MSKGKQRSAFFFNDTATTEIYTLSLHDALPICLSGVRASGTARPVAKLRTGDEPNPKLRNRSEEHTSELQSPDHLVCRLLLEKKKPGRPQPLRGTKGTRKGARLWYVGGQLF